MTPTPKGRAAVVSGVLAADAALHLYWSTGSTWPAPNERALSMAVLGAPLSFAPSIVLPLAALLLAAASVVHATVRFDHPLLRAGTLAVAAGLLVRGLARIVWALGIGAPDDAAFRWLNLLLYTPACLVLAVFCASIARTRRAWVRATALALPVLLVAGMLSLAYGYRPAAADARPEVGSRFVDTPLARFHYVEDGSGSPVVLLAPGASSTFAWADQVAALARDHRVYAVDLPGQGFTTLHDKRFGYDLDAMTGAVGSFLDALGLPRVTLGGNSWSGGWALAFAQRHPERVGALALLAPSGLDEPDPPVWELMKVPVLGELMASFGSDRTTIADALRSTYFANPERATDQAVDAMWAQGSIPENLHASYALERGLDWSVTEAGLGSVRVPTLVLWGAQDKILPAAQARRFRALLPQASVQVLDGCGHALTVDCAERVSSLMTGFLRDR